MLPEGFVLKHAAVDRELIVGGVYVRLFMKDPRYPLRDPSGFLESLLAEFMRSASSTSDADSLQRALTLSAAAVTLQQSQPILCEAVVKLGYIPKLLALLLGIVDADHNATPPLDPPAGAPPVTAAPPPPSYL